MARQSRGRKLAEGIYKDAYGLTAVVKVGKHQPEERWPFGTDLRVLKRWREETRVRLRAHAPALGAGTLAQAIRKYLAVIKGTIDPETFVSRRSELRAWASHSGTSATRNVTAEVVRTAIGSWRNAGKSPKTIRNRVATLAHLWRTLYPGQTPPTEGVDLPLVPKRRPVFVDADTIRDVEATLREHERRGWLRDGKTRARFMVIAATGARPAQVKRTTPRDVDLKRRVWLIPSAKGGEAVALYLNDDMLAAWETFIEADAWGDFNTGSFARRLRNAGWPSGVRPYNLRHSVGMELGERGVDFRVIADMLGHTDERTTRANYVPVLNSRLRAASEMLDKRLGWLAPSAGTTKSRHKRSAKR